jgi:hypothetical protein
MSTFIKLALVGLLTIAASGAPRAAGDPVTKGMTPTFKYMGTLAFGPEGVLFVADAQDVSITALTLGKQLAGAVPGTKDISSVDQKIASLLGIDAKKLVISDMVVDPKSHNTFISAMRGIGAGAAPVLLRVDGAGTIDVISFDKVPYSRVAVPNPPPAVTPIVVGENKFPQANYPDQRKVDDLSGVQTITHMAFIDGKLYVSGLSNEEFASKMRVIPYPFRTVDRGTSVEVYHGSHGQLETFSPVFTFVPYTIGGERTIIASYLCTPLVKFPVSALEHPDSKVRGVTIAELGNRNRPIDMIIYKKNGKDFILMANNSRGVMKLATEPFAAAEPITKPIPGTAGVPFETVASLKGVQQLDLLDASHALLLVDANGALNLQSIPLP